MLVVSPLKALMSDQPRWLEAIGVKVAHLLPDMSADIVKGNVLAHDMSMNS